MLSLLNPSQEQTLRVRCVGWTALKGLRVGSARVFVFPSRYLIAGVRAPPVASVSVYLCLT